MAQCDNVNVTTVHGLLWIIQAKSQKKVQKILMAVHVQKHGIVFRALSSHFQACIQQQLLHASNCTSLSLYWKRGSKPSETQRNFFPTFWMPRKVFASILFVKSPNIFSKKQSIEKVEKYSTVAKSAGNITCIILKHRLMHSAWKDVRICWMISWNYLLLIS